MSLLKKVMIGVSGALCFVFFLFFQIAKSVEARTEQKDVVYPSGNLSDNLFVSQNSKYTPNENFSQIYQFTDVPYLVDLPDGNTADVGSGHIVQTGDNMVIYLSQMDAAADMHAVVLSQYPKVVYINYSQADSYNMTLKEEYGYLNGLPTTYFMDHLVVSTNSGKDAKNAYVLGYCFFPENDVDEKILVSVATTEDTSEAFEKCKQLLDIVTYTVRYDEKLDNTQKTERERAARAAAEMYEAEKKKAEKEVERAMREAPLVTPDATLDVSVSTRQENFESSVGMDEMSIPISVTKDFTNLTILVNWTIENPDVSIRFSGPSGSVTPDLITSKQATVNVGYCPTGEYSLSISNYSELGEINTKLIENGR